MFSGKWMIVVVFVNVIGGCVISINKPLEAFPEGLKSEMLEPLLPKLKELYQQENPNEKVTRASLGSRSWEIVRHDVSGVILRRIGRVWIGAQLSNGDCYIYQHYFAQDNTGPNTWGPLAVREVIFGKTATCAAIQPDGPAEDWRTLRNK